MKKQYWKPPRIQVQLKSLAGMSVQEICQKSCIHRATYFRARKVAREKGLDYIELTQYPRPGFRPGKKHEYTFKKNPEGVIQLELFFKYLMNTSGRYYQPVLQVLLAFEQGLSVGELAKKLGCKGNSLSVFLPFLISAGLIRVKKEHSKGVRYLLAGECFDIATEVVRLLIGTAILQAEFLNDEHRGDLQKVFRTLESLTKQKGSQAEAIFATVNIPELVKLGMRMHMLVKQHEAERGQKIPRNLKPLSRDEKHQRCLLAIESLRANGKRVTIRALSKATRVAEVTIRKMKLSGMDLDNRRAGRRVTITKKNGDAQNFPTVKAAAKFLGISASYLSGILTGKWLNPFDGLTIQ